MDHRSGWCQPAPASDGKDERVFRILVENGINIHAEVISRIRFKQMVEEPRGRRFPAIFSPTADRLQQRRLD